MKNTVQYVSTLLIKNKTSFHIYEEIPINAAKQKINYHYIYIIQYTLHCFKASVHLVIHFSRFFFPGLESLHLIKFLWAVLPGLQFVNKTHTNISEGIRFLSVGEKTTILRLQKCLYTVHNTQGCTQCHIAVEAQRNDWGFCGHVWILGHIGGYISSRSLVENVDKQLLDTDAVRAVRQTFAVHVWVSELNVASFPLQVWWCWIGV